jgi:CMP-N-acetylneuraminic acid synthetase
VSVLERSPSVTGIVLTTDDEEILAFYRSRRDIVLVPRPAELATDTTPSGDVVRHALGQWTMHGGDEPALLLLAQPTSPLRSVADVERAVRVICESGDESLLSACRAEGMRHPMEMYRREGTGHGTAFLPNGDDFHPRQTYETLYQRNGALYIVRTEYFRRTGRLRSERPVIFEMPWERSVNIDTPGDLLVARALIEAGCVDAPAPQSK